MKLNIQLVNKYVIQDISQEINRAEAKETITRRNLPCSLSKRIRLKKIGSSYVTIGFSVTEHHSFEEMCQEYNITEILSKLNT